MTNDLTIQPSSCAHPASSVTDSRPPEYINSDGSRRWRDLPFRCLVVRRRKCSVCGERFRTYEIPIEEAEVLVHRGNREAIIEELLGDMRDFLLINRLQAEAQDPTSHECPSEYPSHKDSD